MNQCAWALVIQLCYPAMVNQCVRALVIQISVTLLWWTSVHEPWLSRFLLPCYGEPVCTSPAYPALSYPALSEPVGMSTAGPAFYHAYLLVSVNPADSAYRCSHCIRDCHSWMGLYAHNRHCSTNRCLHNRAHPRSPEITKSKQTLGPSDPYFFYSSLMNWCM